MGNPQAGLEELLVAWRRLEDQWERTRGAWADSASDAFQNDHWNRLEEQVVVIKREMEHVSESIRKARMHLE